MLNKAVLMGRLTADPELRRTQNNTAVTSFTLAVNRSYTKQGEQPQTDFIDCVAWSGTAEFVSKWFTKGMQVAVSGRIQSRTWEDKQGQKRKSVEVVVEDAYFADSKREPSQSQGGGAPRRQDTFAPAPFDISAGGNEFSELDMDDGDLPF